LPVPDSPATNTAASVFATLRIVANSRRIASHAPIIVPPGASVCRSGSVSASFSMPYAWPTR